MFPNLHTLLSIVDGGVDGIDFCDGKNEMCLKHVLLELFVFKNIYSMLQSKKKT